MRRVNNAIEDLDGETKELESLKPGILVEAEGNENRNGKQDNGPEVDRVTEGLLVGGTFKAKKNVNVDGVQFNSLHSSKESEKTTAKDSQKKLGK